MHLKWFVGIAALWILGTLLSLFMAGETFSSTDSTIMNQLMVIKVAKVGTWSVPVPNSQFFTHGLWSLMNWDFSFLSGSYLTWVLYLLNIGLMFGLLMVFVGVIQSIFSAFRS